MPRTRSLEATYSLGAVSRLTGLSPHVLRAWERRYGAVRPLRTPGGTRRYRESEVMRLRLLRAAVEAGHPISEVAALGDAELERRVETREAPAQGPLQALLSALHRLDVDEVERQLALQLAALGPRRFGSLVVSPLLREVGERWKAGELCVAAEHLASAAIRSLLGSSLRRRALAQAPTVLFTTPPNERHEIGALVAAVAAAEAGANAVFLGPDLPVEEVLAATEQLDARAVALGIARLPAREAERTLRSLRAGLPPQVELWLGGPGSDAVELPSGAQRIESAEALEHKVGLLGARARRAS